MLLEVPDSDMPWLLLVLQYVSLRLPDLWPLISPLTLLANGRRSTSIFVRNLLESLTMCRLERPTWSELNTPKAEAHTEIARLILALS